MSFSFFGTKIKLETRSRTLEDLIIRWRRTRMSSLLTYSDKQPQTDPEFRDRHHILFTRREWQQGSELTYQLRDHGCTQAIIPRSLHDAIHRTVKGGVPIPSKEVCEATYMCLLSLRQFYSASLTVKLQLLISIWSLDCNNPALDAVIRQLEVVNNYSNTT